ncbi:DUF4402 domain-containing protein [Novosphingobium subterraneum]|uniref:DUF4402 domain-containing protein n=1 Tax=Novosphingobium subterraneum TaxID=48936 RepID=UPI003CFD736C
MTRLLLTTLCTLLLQLVPISVAHAQTYTVDAITDANFGDIVSAASGQTVFRSNASSGSVTVASGSGVRLSNTAANAEVTISCSNTFACNATNVQVTLALAGSPTGRVGYITAISVANGTATVSSAYSAGNYVVINLAPIPRRSARTFLIGFDLPVDGNESANPTGSATSSYLITAQRATGGGSDSLVGNILAKVIRPVSIAKMQDLQFGAVTRPTSGSGAVTLTPGGVASVSGTNVRRFPAPAATAAQFTVSGEGGQAVTVSVPTTMTLSGSGGSVTATLTNIGGGPQVLSGSTGSVGTVNVSVGGSVPLSGSSALGTLTGTVTVMVQYN